MPGAAGQAGFLPPLPPPPARQRLPEPRPSELPGLALLSPSELAGGGTGKSVPEQGLPSAVYTSGSGVV